MPYRRRDKESAAPFSSAGGERNKVLRPKEKNGSSIWGKLRWKYLISFLCLWVCLIQYYERTVIKRAANRCQWSKWENWPSGASPHRMALLADPQIMDAHSYPGRPWIVNYFTQQLLDNYHARNWKHLHYHLDPDSTFFLGDLFDGGRRWNDSDWFKEYERFNKIFPKKPNRLTVMSLPGNHDIGFGDTVIEDSLTRFKFYFGDPSSAWEVGNHTIVLLDTISLSDTKNENVSAVPRAFLDSFASIPKKHPRIMLTHVPLYRDPISQTCGSKRESQKPFPMMKGVQYQTVIDHELSQEVLQTISPSLVFSGDDHDYCHISHTYSLPIGQQTAEEITVKSCAMNMGISKPAIQLVSLYNPDDTSASETYHTDICYLPDPYKPIKVYVFTYILTTILFFWMHFHPSSFNRLVGSTYNRKTEDLANVLPIANKKSDSRSSRQELDELFSTHKKLMFERFALNMALMTLMIFLVFVFYYKQI